MIEMNKKLSFLLIIIFLSSLIPLTFVNAAWLFGWDQRVLISIDSGDISGALANFPVLVYISDSSGINNEDITFVFDEIGANSLKIAITESDGTTECKVEIEKWDFGNEQAWLWVKVPSVAHDVDTDIYLYFDNDHADNIANVGPTNSIPAENVWDANFKLVTHMRDDPDTSHIRDSTTNDNDGTKTGANNPAVTTSGFIDDAQDFDGSDSIVIPSNAGLKLSTFTVEFWVKGDAAPGTSAIRQIFAKGSYGMNYFFSWDHTNAAFKQAVGFKAGGVWHKTQISFELFAETWYHMFATYDGTDLDISVNGGAPDSTAPSAVPNVDNFNLRIGSGNTIDGSPQSYFVGLLDDFRISDGDRTIEWGTASYETGRDHLLDWGIAENVIVAPSDLDLLFGAGFNSSSPYVELHWNHSLIDVQFFEVQNSSDGVSWDYLGQTTTTNYTDYLVLNGTERYYIVRACNQTGGIWFNSSFTEYNFEKVYFELGAVAGPSGGGGIGFIMLILICSPIIILLVWRARKR